MVVEALTRERIATGIEGWVDLYQDRLLTFVARMLGSREDAEEVVQDTFAKADRAISRATPERPIEPTAAWFYTIALNTARNRRRRRRLPTVPVDKVKGAIV
ncbi:MAG TPA: sigma factor, partial [Dehalococcoidia bacterium]|nr:sigma factor [Dehalococcoidia bacterium]